MIILDGQKEIEYSGNTRVVIGKFDGIHLGHQKLIKSITEKNDDLKSVVFTFTYETEKSLNDSGRILTREERVKRFLELGVDYLVEYELTKEAMHMEPEVFLKEVLKERLHASEIYCGPDLSFGYKGRGNVELVKALEPSLNIKVFVIDKVKYLGKDISSSRIREAIKEGNMSDVYNMLKG